MAKESTQHKIDRTRKPRVQITYDVEVGDAIERKELPFVVGVLADLSGAREEPLPKLRDRKFVNVDRDNFNTFLAEQKPRVAFEVDNVLSDDQDSTLKVDMTFKSMKDFEPEGIVESVPVLKELLEIRRRLKSVQSRLSTSDDLEELIEGILHQDERRREIAQQLGRETLANDDDQSDTKATETPDKDN